MKHQNSTINNILLVHPSGIGDWLMFSPCLKTLLNAYPQAKIQMVYGQRITGQILSLYPQVSALHHFNLSKRFQCLKTILKLRQTRFDLVVFPTSINPKKISFFAALIRANKKLAVALSPSKPWFLSHHKQQLFHRHRVQNIWRLYGMLNIEKKHHHYTPWLPDEVLNQTLPVKAGSVLMHPGGEAASWFKRWPTKNFVAVISELLKQNRPVSVVLGPGELELAQKFKHLQAHPNFNLLSGLGFKDLIKAIQTHELFFGNDAGLGHLAAALNKPVMTLLGPAAHNIIPFTKKLILIETKTPLACRPCMVFNQSAGCPEQTCMTTISVPEVLLHFEKVAFI